MPLFTATQLNQFGGITVLAGFQEREQVFEALRQSTLVRQSFLVVAGELNKGASMRKERELPLPWAQRRAKMRQRWTIPLQGFDWLCEWIAYWLSKCAFLEVLEYATKLTVFVGLITYIFSAGERRQIAKDQRKAKHYQAWQAIDLATLQGGNAGRFDALTDLNADGQSLAGVQLANAILPEIILTNAFLHHAIFSNAIMYKANLQGANLLLADLQKAQLAYANLKGAFLMGAFLQNASLIGADVAGADFTEAHLEDAHLDGIQNWHSIKSLTGANLFAVVNAPDGFVAWAVDKMGANTVSTSNDYSTPLPPTNPMQSPGSQTSTFLQQHPGFAPTNDYPRPARPATKQTKTAPPKTPPAQPRLAEPLLGPLTTKYLLQHPSYASSNDLSTLTPSKR
jgi:uncharacterized protein YjbI with pentapeptide repeats